MQAQKVNKSAQASSKASSTICPTLHFLEPEAGDREETIFLTQRKLKGEEGNQRKSTGWVEAKRQNPQVLLVWGTSLESQLEGMEGDNIYYGQWAELMAEEEKGQKCQGKR